MYIYLHQPHSFFAVLNKSEKQYFLFLLWLFTIIKNFYALAFIKLDNDINEKKIRFLNPSKLWLEA